jgi:hypothetical protein
VRAKQEEPTAIHAAAVITAITVTI